MSEASKDAQGRPGHARSSLEHMRTPTICAIVPIAACFAFAAPQDSFAQTPGPSHFPPVSGKNLDGKLFNLPGDFAGRVNLVFVAFAREQQSDVESWKPFIDDVGQRFPDVKVYEVPVISRSYSLFRGFIDGGMRRGISDPAVRAATITLYIDKNPFDAALGAGSEQSIVVLLVRPSGEILWRATGRYDAANKPNLDSLLTG